MKPCSWHRSILLQGHPGTKRGKHALPNIDTQWCQRHIWTAKHQCFRNTLPSDAKKKFQPLLLYICQWFLSPPCNFPPKLWSPVRTFRCNRLTYTFDNTNARWKHICFKHSQWKVGGTYQVTKLWFCSKLTEDVCTAPVCEARVKNFHFHLPCIFVLLCSHSLSTVQSAASARALESVLQLIFCACLCPTLVSLVCRHINFSAFEPQQVFTARGVSGDFLVPGLQHP